MRVLHVHSGNLFGGVETFLLQLAGRARAAFHSDFALCFEGRLADELRAAGATVHSLGRVRLRNPVTAWRARRRLRGLLESHRFDVILFHNTWSLALFGGVARERGVFTACYLHGPVSGTLVDRLASRQPPDLLLCNSRFTAESRRPLFERVEAATVYLPLALDRFGARPLGEERGSLRASLGLDAETVGIVQVSRMEPWKGQALHLQALARLPADARWKAFFVGGPQRPAEAAFARELQEQAKELGLAERVRFLGERSDIPRLLSAMDVYCQPNLAPEPFGLSLVEALAAGLPVVTCAGGGADEIVTAQCGRLVERRAESVAAVLAEWIASPGKRAELAERAPLRADELCRPERQLTQLRDALSRGLESPRLAG